MSNQALDLALRDFRLEEDDASQAKRFHRLEGKLHELAEFAFPALGRGKTQSGSTGVELTRAHRPPHVYLVRRVSTKVLGEVACFGSKPLCQSSLMR